MDRIILLETQKVFKKICGIRIFFGKFEKKVIPYIVKNLLPFQI